MYIIAMIHRNVLENTIDSLHYLSWGKIKRLNSVEIICTHFNSLLKLLRNAGIWEDKQEVHEPSSLLHLFSLGTRTLRAVFKLA